MNSTPRETDTFPSNDSTCTECGDWVPVGENYCLGCVPDEESE